MTIEQLLAILCYVVSNGYKTQKIFVRIDGQSYPISAVDIEYRPPQNGKIDCEAFILTATD